MAGQSLVFSESIDDVLKIVQETPRGRWFIEAYAQRVKGEGTSNILAAITKLENHISSISNSGTSEDVLQKARSAIALARQEIANLEPKTATLSNEAKLFANLAEMSRKAFGENQGGKGVERALKLIVDLDHDLNDTTAANENPVTSKPAQQYFKQDEAIFEPAPAPKLVAEAAPVAKVIEMPEAATRGAKLVIRRLVPAVSAMPTAEESSIENEPSQAPTISVEAPQPETLTNEPIAIVPETEAKASPGNSRIVIIRRKVDETIAVPLIDLEVEVNAA